LLGCQLACLPGCLLACLFLLFLLGIKKNADEGLKQAIARNEKLEQTRANGFIFFFS